MIFRELKDGERFFLIDRRSLGLLIKLDESLKTGNGLIVKAVTGKGVAVTKINDEMKVKKQEVKKQDKVSI